MTRAKKLVVFILAAIIVFTYGTNNVFAAVPKYELSESSVNLQAGQQKKLVVKNVGKNDRVTWKSNKKSVVVVSSTGTIKAIKCGKAKVICTVKRKNQKKYRLTCDVIIKNNSLSKYSKTVGTQKELEQALKSKNLKNLTIKTSQETELTIPYGNYLKTKLIINAPKAEITNYATFMSVEIQDIKKNTWTENGKENSFIFDAKNVHIIVSTEAEVANIIVKESNEYLCVENNGKINNIEVMDANEVVFKGDSNNVVPVKINKNVSSIKITSEVPLLVQNNTKKSINILTPDGEQQVEANSSGSILQKEMNNTPDEKNITDGSTSGNSGYVDNSGNENKEEQQEIELKNYAPEMIPYQVARGVTITSIEIKRKPCSDNVHGAKQKYKYVLSIKGINTRGEIQDEIKNRFSFSVQYMNEDGRGDEGRYYPLFVSDAENGNLDTIYTQNEDGSFEVVIEQYNMFSSYDTFELQKGETEPGTIELEKNQITLQKGDENESSQTIKMVAKDQYEDEILLKDEDFNINVVSSESGLNISVKNSMLTVDCKNAKEGIYYIRIATKNCTDATLVVTVRKESTPASLVLEKGSYSVDSKNPQNIETDIVVKDQYGKIMKVSDEKFIITSELQAEVKNGVLKINVEGMPCGTYSVLVTYEGIKRACMVQIL